MIPRICPSQRAQSRRNSALRRFLCQAVTPGVFDAIPTDNPGSAESLFNVWATMTPSSEPESAHADSAFWMHRRHSRRLAGDAVGARWQSILLADSMVS